MLRQLLSSGNTGRDALKQDGFYSSGSPTTILMAPPQSVATDVILTSVPPPAPFGREFSSKQEISYSPPFAVELCPNDVVVKNEDDQKSLAVLSNMPPSNCFVQQQTAAPLVMRYPGEDISGHISGTTELFSSTFAMLSADGMMPEADWAGQQNCDQKIVPVMYAVNTHQAQTGQSNEFGQPYPQQLIQVNSQGYGAPASFDQRYVNCSGQANVHQPQAPQPVIYYQAQPTASDTAQNSGPITPADNNNGFVIKSGNQTQTTFSQGFQELAQIPVSSATSSGRNTPLADNENDVDERVMCMACRGVYPSRRSLTGHIGRNEKCREIIGRNYLDQLGGCADKVSVSGSPGGTVGPAETISPICPYCDRFISHYKGNIRRHINQCLKTDRTKSKKGSGRKQEFPSEPVTPVQYSESGYPLSGYSNDACYDGYQPHMLTATPSDLQWETASANSNSFPISQPSPQQQHPKDSKNNDDPYLCSVCDFVTVYKGNMKRHLTTCHSVTEEDFGEGGLESLRASRRSGDLQSRIGKVSRGRRPKSVQEECRKRAKLDLLKSSSPVIMENSSLGAESKSPTSSGVSSIENTSAVSGDSNSGCSIQEQFGGSERCQPQSVSNLSGSSIREPNNANVYIPQQQSCDIRDNSNTNCNTALFSGEGQLLNDGSSQDTGSTSSSNIDEIINAVASNQLGCIPKKTTRQGRTSRGGGRRSAVPKTVCNMEEVRDYWEAERLNSGTAALPSMYFPRSRNAHFSAAPSQMTTGNASPASQR